MKKLLLMLLSLLLLCTLTVGCAEHDENTDKLSFTKNDNSYSVIGCEESATTI